MQLQVFFQPQAKKNYLPTDLRSLGKKISRWLTQKSDELVKAPEINDLVCFCVIHLTVLKKKTHKFPIALKFFVFAFITIMISERVQLSSVVDIVVKIFQEGKLNRILVGDIEKKSLMPSGYWPLKIKRKKKFR